MKKYISQSQQSLFKLCGARPCTLIDIYFASSLLSMPEEVMQLFILDDEMAAAHFLQLKEAQKIVTESNTLEEYVQELMKTAIRLGATDRSRTAFYKRANSGDSESLMKKLHLQTLPETDVIYQPTLGTHENFGVAVEEQIAKLEVQPYPAALLVTAGGHTIVMIKQMEKILFFDPKQTLWRSALEIYEKEEKPDLVEVVCKRLGSAKKGADFSQIVTKDDFSKINSNSASGDPGIDHSATRISSRSKR